MATAFSYAIDALSQLGLQQALIRRVERDQSLHNTAFTLQLARAVVTGIGIALAAPLAAAWFAEPRLVGVLQILAVASVLSGLRNIGTVEFGRDMLYERQFVLLAVPRLIQVPLTIALALLWQSYWALVAGIVLSKLLDVVMSYVMHPYRPRLSLAGWRELLAFSLWSWAASVVAIIWDRCDPAVIGPAVGTAQLGVYLLAIELAMLPISELVGPVSDVLFAGFSQAQRDGRRPVALAMPVASALVLLVMPLMIGISCIAGYVVAALLGPKWEEAQKLVAIAAWLGLFAPFGVVCQSALLSANHLRANFMANAMASALKLGVLSAVVAATHDLVTIIAASVLIVGGEAAIFATILMRAEAADARTSLPGLLRTLAAGVATLVLLRAMDLGWNTVTLPGWQALFTGLPIGIGCVAVFCAISAALWQLAGRPDGSETRVVRLMAQIAGPFLARLKMLG
jgi:O-antigen/teichoic acid export membrane protein